MSSKKYPLVYTKPLPLSEGEYPGFKPRTEKVKLGLRAYFPTMEIDYDVAVPMRDGKKIYIDVCRPAKATRPVMVERPEGDKYPALIAWGLYGKHGRRRHDFVSKYTAFEGPDPLYWCANGYVIINADPRGFWNSEGDASYFSEQEAEDCYDLIEWVGTQGWSNGKVGMLGVSYLAWIQWQVAALNPPHLAAISPWEGVSDFYRELTFHGGIPDVAWQAFGKFTMYSNTRVEDLLTMCQQHPLFDGYWASKNADLTKITVPAFVVASWSDHGLHTRGTLEGFKKISSQDKWLLVHGRKKWETFYQWDMVEKQIQFFNRFLKNIDNRVKYWPEVTLEVREQFFIGNLKKAKEWPLASTKYEKLYLDAGNHKMSKTSLKNEAQVRYNANDAADKTQNAQFEYKFDEKTELTGHMKLKLWVQAEGNDDMDLFVAIEKIDRAGYIVPFPYFSMHDDGPVALGWLRVSHRELDEKKSTPYQPVHKHEREIKLEPREIVPVEIEIWPSSTLFAQGEKLRVIVQGSDIYSYSDGTLTNLHATINRGEHVIYTGGKYDSHLLVPVIPSE